METNENHGLCPMNKEAWGWGIMKVCLNLSRFSFWKIHPCHGLMWLVYKTKVMAKEFFPI